MKSICQRSFSSDAPTQVPGADRCFAGPVPGPPGTRRARPGPLAPRPTPRGPDAVAGPSPRGGGRDRGPRRSPSPATRRRTLTWAPAERALPGAGGAGTATVGRRAGRGGAPGRGRGQAVRGGAGPSLPRAGKAGNGAGGRNLAIIAPCSRGLTIGGTRRSFSKPCGHWSRAALPASWPRPPPTLASGSGSGSGSGLAVRKEYLLLLRGEGVICPAPTSEAAGNYSALSFVRPFRHPCTH